jgi:hypothetical protein
MLQENVAWFGQELDWTINVVPEPSSIALAAMGFAPLALLLACSRQSETR